MFSADAIRKDFPIFSNVKPYGKDLVYLDNAASAQKPQCVLDAVQNAYAMGYANVHRGLHYLANKITQDYEQARESVRRFIHAKECDEIIWTSGATDGLNLLADSLGADLKEGDEIILSIAEHHSNIVPWHFLRERKGCVIRWIGIDAQGNLDMNAFEQALCAKTKIVSITHMSNVLGTINPIKDIAQKAHNVGAMCIADGSQAAVHLPIDVQDLDIDFYVATGHKLYAPTGIGFLYGKKHLLEKMRPYRGGGEMIDMVSFDIVTYNTPPHRFEAGTPPIVQAIGLGVALDYLMALGVQDIYKYEQEILAYAHEVLETIKGLTLYGTSADKGSVIAFNIEGLHPHDIATYIDRWGIAVRAGHHCTQPLMSYLGVSSTARASFALYNTKKDVEILADALLKAQMFFT